tara:strand:+ start:180 stop:1940 length:1761 start_codon:yes stop_codon:yes gene_type:complete
MIELNKHKTIVSNVVVIGCGGAGLRAAIEIKNKGLDVCVLGKRPKEDPHTVLAAGGVNAAFGNLDNEDSWRQHFVDTYLEGYKIGNPQKVEILAKESMDLVSEVDEWGANLKKLENGKFDQRYFGAHKYRRTCFSGDFTGMSILKALLNKADSLEIPIYDSQYVTEILVKDNKCFGVMSFDINSSIRTVYFADAVILCTGGHTRIWKKSSSRKNENTGDGLYLALKAGCKLVDMEMVQFHPSGMLFPEEIEGTLVTEAVRGEGGVLLNKFGDRFMKNYDIQRMELSTRDRVAFANYTEIIEGRGTENGGVFLDISHKSKEFIIQKLPTIYRKFLEFQMLDISKSPMEVAPTAHYSMGGIVVDPINLSTSIQGLFAAGEVSGGLHGANRLGGNSLGEILVFGKRAGKSGVEFSRKLNYQIRSHETIRKAHDNIDKFIKKGDFLALPLLNELRSIMWKCCGVVKNKKLLNEGLIKIKKLKNKLENVDVRVNHNSCEDLFNFFDLQSSIFSAEATIISAISRNESRGAHQRSDFKEQDSFFECNFLVELDQENNTLKVIRSPIKKLSNELQTIVFNLGEKIEIKNKLLE